MKTAKAYDSESLFELQYYLNGILVHSHRARGHNSMKVEYYEKDDSIICDTFKIIKL